MNEFIFGRMAAPENRLEIVQQQNQGVRHEFRLEPPAPTADDEPIVTVIVGLPQPTDKIVCQIQLPEQRQIELDPSGSEWDLANWCYIQIWQGALPSYPDGTLVRYVIEAQMDGGECIAADDGAIFSYIVGQSDPPNWAAEAIIYQIFPDRFDPGEDREWHSVGSLSDIHGGTLRGIIERLDYVAELGFNCIWLNPFFPDTTHHGYHATDYFSVNPRLGDMDDIRELVEKAHSKGIRMILDFVANHWSSQHPTFVEAQSNPDSEYVGWYHWDNYPNEYRTFFGVKELPQINLMHPGARAYMLQAAEFWLKEVGFDGYRLDYAIGVPMDFWTDFRQTVKRANPDAWIFGESVDQPSTQRQFLGRFDGSLDFLLLQAMRDTFAFETMNVAQFANFLDLHEAFFPSSFSRPSFLDNHDMNRFLWLVQGDVRKLKLAALCQFTLGGLPIVYYGTEVGLSQERDVHHTETGFNVMEESRLPMLWGDEQNSELRSYYRWLIQLRKSHPAIWRGTRRTVLAEGDRGLLAYKQEDDQDSLLVVLNLSDDSQSWMVENRPVELEPWSGQVF